MPVLKDICEQLEIKTKGVIKTNPAFRLWLTSYPSEAFPTTVLQSGIKMTNEAPKSLKSNMLSSYKMELITKYSDPWLDHHEGKIKVFKKLAYSLCMFHAILLQRRNFGSLGWNKKYDFTASDLQISTKHL
mmetsp:Transcript_26215/g.18600  ORF Transcript_26215/g.18600 Transcript_26215/m.18600 type:complete len:131 (-) Transcript_26215:1509-1901(-)